MKIYSPESNSSTSWPLPAVRGGYWGPQGPESVCADVECRGSSYQYTYSLLPPYGLPSPPPPSSSNRESRKKT